MTASTELIESLAADIGAQVYIEIAKWHLYLSDAKLHLLVAEKLYGLLESDQLSQDSIQTVLKTVSVSIGGGQNEISLADLVPLQCQTDLLELLEEKQRDL